MDYVLIPGAGGRAWYWHLVASGLTGHGHRCIAVELPSDDDTKGLLDYAHAVLDAVDTRGEVVIVAASLGAFIAPLVVEPFRTAAVVLVNPMIPVPGETPGAWWGNTGAVEARRARASRLGYSVDFDPGTYMLHDVPPEVLATATPKGEQSQRPFRDPCIFSGWPAATTVISGEDDRFFPLEFQQQLARERLHVEPVVVPGGHLVALAHAIELTAAILTLTGGR
ncbi:alpha/beta hydrolase [Phycicoccus sp. SLBN-51]|uniref:alpha/beta fold hydrolase n=1 Tax=Phycicoccus sp. SLBN-51 TaxID=2768447 RepID=UPI0011546B4E|nr:alpha/beta hydrolase [Phycicoccus sp. SLBN-51]TQJ52177.1 alpha/beta hydrolase family protein [Phycicoccus sp. SLBN-51]